MTPNTLFSLSLGSTWLDAYVYLADGLGALSVSHPPRLAVGGLGHILIIWPPSFPDRQDDRAPSELDRASSSIPPVHAQC